MAALHRAMVRRSIRIQTGAGPNGRVVYPDPPTTPRAAARLVNDAVAAVEKARRDDLAGALCNAGADGVLPMQELRERAARLQRACKHLRAAINEGGPALPVAARRDADEYLDLLGTGARRARALVDNGGMAPAESSTAQ